MMIGMPLIGRWVHSYRRKFEGEEAGQARRAAPTK